MTEQGCIRESITYFEGKVENITNKENTVSGYYMDKNGTIFEEYKGIWKKSTYTPAIAGAEQNLLYMSALSENEIKWGKGEDYENCNTYNIQFQFADINGDGIEEILLKNDMASGFSGNEGIGHLYNGEMKVFYTDSEIRGYYPNSGIFVADTWIGDSMSASYWRYNGRSAVKLFTIFHDMWDEETTYYIDRKFKLEIEEGKDILGEPNKSDNIEISEEMFQTLVGKYIGEEELCEIDETKYIENTKENRIEVFLSDILKEENAIVLENKVASEIKNPIVKNKEVVEWDTITFGSYWQNDTNKDGIADESDEKEPIRWRVLSCDGKVALLLAEEKLLVGKGFDWEKDFQKEAFNEEELNYIQQKEGQEERSFLLSLEDVKNSKYGFSEEENIELSSRKSNFSEFALYKMNSVGKRQYLELEGEWWLGSKGKDFYEYWNDTMERIRDYDETQYYVGSLGEIDMTKDAEDIKGIRPAIYLDLSDETMWGYAGTVRAEDYQEMEYR